MIEVIPNQQTPKIENNLDLNNLSENEKIQIESFFNYAKSRDDAIGLAANQISFDKVRYMKRLFAIKLKSGWILCINPKIVSVFGYKTIQEEGCLTWPERKIIAERWSGVKVQYYDLEGNIYNKSYHSLYAQIFQHELNHLDGIEEKVI